jgi:hypothetical protein
MDEPWYSARCLFVHEHTPSDVLPARVYEERIVLIRAASFDDAIAQAEEEARQYAAGLDGVRYLEHVDVYHLFDDDVGSGTEVYSVLRDGTPDPDSFVQKLTGDFWNCGDRSEPGTKSDSSAAKSGKTDLE